VGRFTLQVNLFFPQAVLLLFEQVWRINMSSGVKHPPHGQKRLERF
jgi:hypothetical protein